MKKYLVVLAAVMMVITMVSGAFAASPTTLNVTASATVATNCVASGGTLSFPNVDPDGSSNVTASGSGISIKCTKGTAVTVADSSTNKVGSQMYMVNGSNKLKYAISYVNTLVGEGTSAATDLGNSDSGHLNLTGTIAPADAQTLPAGSYSDTIVLTLTY